MQERTHLRSVLSFTVIIAGLGYFVDLFDITLYGVVRVSSLKDLGLTDPALILAEGIFIYNMQMLGMMIGGLFWGRLADRRGRVSVLFASILLYSLANLANVFITSVNGYAACRFIGGLGLAGELGAAVTLVAESLPIERRGMGTTIVATLGMLGVLAAAFFAQRVSWRMAYGIGALLGFALLAARFTMKESQLFHESRKAKVRQPITVLFRDRRWLKYLSCIAVGLPIYFTTGILFTFAPELAKGLGVHGEVSAGNAILFGSAGLTLGDLLSGLLSQWLRSRKQAIRVLLIAGFCFLLFYCFVRELEPPIIYGLSFGMGLTIGYWAVLVTMAAEQFGTNFRATVATTVPNFVRGSAVLAASGFALLKSHTSASNSAFLVGAICFGCALLALSRLDETFARDLQFEEQV